VATLSEVPRPKSKKKRTTKELKGWKAIAEFLVIPAATARRWTREGMPTRREGRFTFADPKELTAWLGREANMPGPAQIMAGKADVASSVRPTKIFAACFCRSAHQVEESSRNSLTPAKAILNNLIIIENFIDDDNCRQLIDLHSKFVILNDSSDNGFNLVDKSPTGSSAREGHL
jgi:hypothetical protein